MTLRCIVPSCTTNSKDNPELKLFCLPGTASVLEKWITNLGLRQFLENKTQAAYNKFRVCSLHFDVSCFQTPEKQKLNRGVVPFVHDVPETQIGSRSTYNTVTSVLPGVALDVPETQVGSSQIVFDLAGPSLVLSEEFPKSDYPPVPSSQSALGKSYCLRIIDDPVPGTSTQEPGTSTGPTPSTSRCIAGNEDEDEQKIKTMRQKYVISEGLCILETDDTAHTEEVKIENVIEEIKDPVSSTLVNVPTSTVTKDISDPLGQNELEPARKRTKIEHSIDSADTFVSETGKNMNNSLNDEQCENKIKPQIQAFCEYIAQQLNRLPDNVSDYLMHKITNMVTEKIIENLYENK